MYQSLYIKVHIFFVYNYIYLCSIDETIHKKRRNTTMSDSMGILDEMSLELAENISYDESAFAPECSELRSPQPMHETGKCATRSEMIVL